MKFCVFVALASRSALRRCACNAESRRYMGESDCSCAKRIVMASCNVICERAWCAGIWGKVIAAVQNALSWLRAM